MAVLAQAGKIRVGVAPGFMLLSAPGLPSHEHAAEIMTVCGNVGLKVLSSVSDRAVHHVPPPES